MALSTKAAALVHATAAGERLAQAANTAYWLDSYGHEGAGYQLQIMREEFRKLELAFADIDAAPIRAPIEEAA